MADYAGRASVALHTQLFFATRKQIEQGYVLFVRYVCANDAFALKSGLKPVIQGLYMVSAVCFVCRAAAPKCRCSTECRECLTEGPGQGAWARSCAR